MPERKDNRSSLGERIERLEAIHEIQNLMGRFEFLRSAQMYEEVVQLFAQETPGVSAQLGDWGSYEGIEGIKRLYPGLHMWADGGRIGRMYEQCLTTRVIEVAGDGKTAKGVWISPGNETAPDKETGKIHTAWCWLKYACDFVKEGGKWKIWHLHGFLTFISPYEKGWVEGGKPTHSSVPKAPAELRPDGPSTNRQNPYDPNGVRELLPAPPEPYQTYDAKVEWKDPRKSQHM